MHGPIGSISLFYRSTPPCTAHSSAAMVPGPCQCGQGHYENRTCTANCSRPRGPGHPRHPMHRSRHAARVRSRSPAAPVLQHRRMECWHCNTCRPEWVEFGWTCFECKGEGRCTTCYLCYWEGRPIKITVRDMAGNVQGPFEMSASTTIESLERFMRVHFFRTANLYVKGITFLLDPRHTVLFANVWPCVDNLYRQAIPASARCGECAASSGDLRLVGVRRSFTQLDRRLRALDKAEEAAAAGEWGVSSAYMSEAERSSNEPTRICALLHSDF